MNGKDVHKIIVACDAGMGSSVMLASQLRKELRKYSVTVEHTPTAVRVEVTDTGGTPAPEAAAGTGRGLLGLRERLTVYGGTLSTGPRPTGGYRVEAVIPLNGTEKTP